MVSVMFDEYAIKKYAEFADGKFHGHVDLGTGDFNDDAPMATDALVIMAVSVNEHFKIPLIYFLIKGLNGEERANLVKETFMRLHETGVLAVSFTCDGPSVDFSTLKALGATLTFPDMQPTIPHPGDEESKVRNGITNIFHPQCWL